jgi:uncharacterized Ntn-hydrolase superfamily protein
MTLVRGTRWKAVGLIASTVVACAAVVTYVSKGGQAVLDMRYENRAANDEAHKKILQDLGEAKAATSVISVKMNDDQKANERRLDRIERSMDTILGYTKYTAGVLRGEPAFNPPPPPPRGH